MADKSASTSTPRRQNTPSHPEKDGPRKGTSVAAPESEWLLRTLTSLGHPDPPSAASCLAANDAGSDDRLTHLALWLEDRVIRLWDDAKREGLRSDFWAAAGRYLSDLDCPPSYHLSGDGDGDGGGDASSGGASYWRNDPGRRAKVVHWLVSCAVSEAYGDAKDKLEEAEAGEGSRSDGVGRSAEESLDGEAASLTPEAFPLGFTTNDDEVDRIATALRMRYLLDLRAEQDRVNRCVAEMQRVTVRNQGGGDGKIGLELKRGLNKGGGGQGGSLKKKQKQLPGKSMPEEPPLLPKEEIEKRLARAKRFGMTSPQQTQFVTVRKQGGGDGNVGQKIKRGLNKGGGGQSGSLQKKQKQQPGKSMHEEPPLLPKEEIEKRLSRAKKFGTMNPQQIDELKTMLRRHRFGS